MSNVIPFPQFKDVDTKEKASNLLNILKERIENFEGTPREFEAITQELKSIESLVLKLKPTSIKQSA